MVGSVPMGKPPIHLSVQCKDTFHQNNFNMFANILSTVTSIQGGQDTQQINGIEMMNCRLPHSLILKKSNAKWQLPSQKLSPSDEDKSALLFASY